MDKSTKTVDIYCWDCEKRFTIDANRAKICPNCSGTNVSLRPEKKKREQKKPHDPHALKHWY